MCGIYGIIPKTTNGISFIDKELLEQMMILTSLRGRDSSGIAAVMGLNKRPKVIKTVGDPFYLLDNAQLWDPFDKLLNSIDLKAVFGHGRAATKGNVTAKNAHPFTYEHITMIHNGTILGGLDYKAPCGQEVEVDSHALCVLMAKEGISEALKTINGAYAVVVHDNKEGKLYIARNSERPLHCIDTHTRFVFMSEYSAIRYLASRNTAMSYIKDSEICQFKAETLYSWDFEKHQLKVEGELHKKTSYYGNGYKMPVPNFTRYQNDYVAPTKTEAPKQEDTKSSNHVFGILKSIEPKPSSKEFKYMFEGEAGTKFVSYSSKHLPDKIGCAALVKTKPHIRVYPVEGGESYYQVKFKDIDWYEDITDPTEEEIESPEVKTFFGRTISRKKWKDIAATERCAICDGSVHENEAANTGVTSDDSVICVECITAGRHIAYGFSGGHA